MNAVSRLIAFCIAALALSMVVSPTSDAQSLPYQLSKVSTGYRISGLPPGLVSDLVALPSGEKLVMSLVDPMRGTSKVAGRGQRIDSSTLILATSEILAFAPDPNRTYLLFELDEAVAGGGGCSGCTLTNRNLKSHSPQICWCFSKLAASGGAALGCHGRTEQASRLLRIIGDAARADGGYGECYPSSGEGGEDCSVFLAICEGAGGGAGSLPGGGYSCSVR
jgi:hypothetical protein